MMIPIRDCVIFQWSQENDRVVEHVKEDLSYATALGSLSDEVSFVVETDAGIVDSSGHVHKEKECYSTLAQCITVTNRLAVLKNSIEIKTFAGVNYLKEFTANIPTWNFGMKLDYQVLSDAKSNPSVNESLADAICC